MKFTECKDLEIINCNYARLKERRKAVEKENEKIKKKNKSLRVSEVTFIILTTLITIALTCAFMGFVWVSVQFNLESGPFFTLFEHIDPMWVKYTIEGVILLLCASGYRAVISQIFFSTSKKRKPLEKIPEQALFAIAAEGRTIGNLEFQKKPANKPFVRQSTAFKFDALNKKETECHSFVSAADKWYTVLVPGLYNTIIDVASLTIYRPYFSEDETVRTLEGAYINGKLQIKKLEEAMAQQKTESDGVIEQLNTALQLAQQENEVLEQEISDSRKAEAKAYADAKKSQDALDETARLYYEEQEKNRTFAEEEKKKIAVVEEAKAEVQNALDQMTAAKEALERELVARTAERDDLTTRIQAIEAERKELAESLGRKDEECNARLREKDEACSTQLQAKDAECEQRLQQTIADLQAERAKVATMTQEAEAMRHNIEQLEHNAKSDRTYHQNLEEEYKRLSAEHAETTKKIAELQAKAREYETDRHALEEQKKLIATLEERCAMLTAQKATLEQQIASMSADYAEYAANRPQIEEKVARYDEMEQRVAELEKEAKSLAQSNADLRTRNKKLAEDVASAQARCREAEDESEKKTTDLLDVQQKLTTAQDYITSLESKVDRAYKDAESARRAAQDAKGGKAAESPEEIEKRRAEEEEFRRLMQEREDAIRKAREDAEAASKKPQTT